MNLVAHHISHFFLFFFFVFFFGELVYLTFTPFSASLPPPQSPPSANINALSRTMQYSQHNKMAIVPTTDEHGLSGSLQQQQQQQQQQQKESSPILHATWQWSCDTIPVQWLTTAGSKSRGDYRGGCVFVSNQRTFLERGFLMRRNSNWLAWQAVYVNLNSLTDCFLFWLLFFVCLFVCFLFFVGFFFFGGGRGSPVKVVKRHAFLQDNSVSDHGISGKSKKDKSPGRLPYVWSQRFLKNVIF